MMVPAASEEPVEHQPRPDDVEARSGPEDEAKDPPEPEGEDEAARKLREALARIDQVDDVQQRFLSEARRQVSELHLEATRARAAALEEARKLVADAEAEAAAVLEAAREEAARLRGESEQEVKAHAEVLLAVAHKERDDLMAAASAAADRLREEAALAGESLLNTAQAKAVRLVQEAKEEAARIRSEAAGAGGVATGSRPAPAGGGLFDAAPRRTGTEQVAQEVDLRRLQAQLRALAESFGNALDALAAGIAPGKQAPVAEPAASGRHGGSAPEAAAPPAPAAPAAPPAPPAPGPVEAPVPLIGSRGNQGTGSAPTAPVVPVVPAHAGPEPERHPEAAGSLGGTSAWTHSPDWPRPRRGRGWRYRGA